MDRAPHPCLGTGCRHPDSEHVATPELAGPEEIVVWCFACRRHETRAPRRWFSHRPRASSVNRVARTPRAY